MYRFIPPRFWRGLCCVVLATALGCTRKHELPPRNDLNVIVLVVDTLRARDLGCYGGERSPSPAIDALAQNGVRFSRAYAAAPWTKPSIASILTGRLPAAHQVRRLNSAINPAVPTAAELLQAEGFETGGVVSHIVLARKYGYARGFDTYLNVNPNAPHKTVSGARVTDQAIQWLGQRRKDKPFFLFLHYFDPHYNYIHHPRFSRTDGYRGPLTPAMDIRELRAKIGQFAPADVEFLKNLYAEEIAYTDWQIARLMDHLKEADLTRKTLIVVTADHGEEFLEHGALDHTGTLYEELIHIPLIFSLPGTLAPAVVDTPVSQVDILPTLLSFGRNRWSGSSDGESLVPLLTGGTDAGPSHPIISEVDFVSSGKVKDAFKTCTVQGDDKLIHDRSADAWQLYDLKNDPHELHPIASPKTERLEALRGILRGYEDPQAQPQQPAQPPDGDLTNKEVEQLRTLGYM